MQIKLFTIPILHSEAFETDMNRFLRSVRVLDIESRLIEKGSSVYWSFCIKYLPLPVGQQENRLRESTAVKKDYRALLGEVGYAKFDKLRVLRKKIANEEAVAAYVIFTDDELSNISQLTDVSLAGMKSIKGIGEKKIAKYGEQFITLLQQIQTPELPANETDRIPDTPHN
ncbi:MAG TPA: HRDC domain-containing protein [Chitinophagales bacterium]|nr:HRDC domain-containing protein [Chitinophagales bacterium]HRK26311.1 HRDC domain-containing protein [Chitinophagales bacterium]